MSPLKDAPQIVLKRSYEPAAKEDGCRILVERLWPRGVSKDAAEIALWAKDAAPTTELRKWFSHDHDKWEEFKSRYYAELKAKPVALEPIRERLAGGVVTFVFASKETEFNNAVALKEYLERPN
ncbi:MAG: hypothetical protein ACI8W3_002720 [Myxococcota bacterium]|jgi:uncharacterized protein YeaO (DUF488 family)